MFPNLYFLLIIVVVSILDTCRAFVSYRSDSVGIALKSSEGSWGSWSNNFYCKEGNFAVGFDLGVEPRISGDDTAANWFRLVCDDGEVIKANNEASWGSTVGSVRCDANFKLLGFKTKVEVYQGGGDDTALNSAKGLCASTSGTEEKEPSNGGPWGDWAVSYARCSATNQAVCGFRQKVEAWVGGGDDTALNAVQLHCCSRPSPSPSPPPVPVRSDNKGSALKSSEGALGSWSNIFYCNEGHYAVGFDLGVEPRIGDNSASNWFRFDLSVIGVGGDNSAANWFRLVCDDGMILKANNEAPWGSTVGSVRCDANFYLLGFKTKVEVNQGGGDDTALNSVKGFCDAADRRTIWKEPSNGGAMGNWALRGTRCMASRDIICGFRQKVEAHMGAGDDSALNAVQLYCCSRPVVAEAPTTCKGDDVRCAVGSNECCSGYYCDDDKWSSDECEPQIKYGYKCTSKLNSVEEACEGLYKRCRNLANFGNLAFCGGCVADDGVTITNVAGGGITPGYCCDGYPFKKGWWYWLNNTGYCSRSSALSPYMIELGVVGVVVLVLFFWTAYNLCVCIKTRQAEHKYKYQMTNGNGGTQIQMCT